MQRNALALTVALLSATISGCEATHLFVAHHTVVGVDAAIDTQMTRGHLVVGYDRNFLAIVPKTVETTTPGQRDAMSAIACNKVQVKGIVLTQFTEYLATGDAAKAYAEALKARKGRQLFNCLDAEAAANNPGN
jgi:hypothetical protein